MELLLERKKLISERNASCHSHSRYRHDNRPSRAVRSRPSARRGSGTWRANYRPGHRRYGNFARNCLPEPLCCHGVCTQGAHRHLRFRRRSDHNH